MAARRSRLRVLVLAAGSGRPARGREVGPLDPVAGRPLLAHVLDAVRALRPDRIVAVVGAADAAAARGALDGAAVVLAPAPPPWPATGQLLIVPAHLPALRGATLRRLVERHRRTRAALTRLDGAGASVLCADAAALRRALGRRPALAGAARALVARGDRVVTLAHGDAEELRPVITREDLARANAVLYGRKARELMRAGVTLLDPARTWVDPRARVGRDSVLYPGVIVEGPSRLGRRCIVRSGCRLTDVTAGDGVEILECCVAWQSRLGDGARLGPFAHLRPGSILEPGSRVGNFVELKLTRLGPGSKANHLAYLGDATIGADCNIGAGTITCNYDGVRKSATVLGRGVFIGSDTQLVAPVRVHDGAYVAAGTTVTEDVPAGALAIGRGRQRNVAGWVARRRRRGGRKPRRD